MFGQDKKESLGLPRLVGIKEIADEMGISNTWARTLLERAVADGIVRQFGEFGKSRKFVLEDVQRWAESQMSGLDLQQ